MRSDVEYTALIIETRSKALAEALASLTADQASFRPSDRIRSPIDMVLDCAELNYYISRVLTERQQAVNMEVAIKERGDIETKDKALTYLNAMTSLLLETIRVFPENEFVSAVPSGTDEKTKSFVQMLEMPKSLLSYYHGQLDYSKNFSQEV